MMLNFFISLVLILLSNVITLEKTNNKKKNQKKYLLAYKETSSIISDTSKIQPTLLNMGQQYSTNTLDTQPNPNLLNATGTTVTPIPQLLPAYNGINNGLHDF